MCAVLEFQSGNCHFGSSPRHLLGLIQSEHPAYRADTLSCMQEGDQVEEPLTLFYQIPLWRLVVWNKWWHLTARKLLRAYQRRYWGLVGNYLKTVTGVTNPHLAQVRTTFGRGQGQLLPQLSNLAKIIAGRLLYSTQYTMAESADIHPTAGRRRREQGPPSGLALPRLERVSDTEGEHSDDSAGEKEAKRQRSEPSTSVNQGS